MAGENSLRNKKGHAERRGFFFLMGILVYLLATSSQ